MSPAAGRADPAGEPARLLGERDAAYKRTRLRTPPTPSGRPRDTSGDGVRHYANVNRRIDVVRLFNRHLRPALASPFTSGQTAGGRPG